MGIIILIIEDEINIAESLGALLRKAGYKVKIASSGIEGLKYIRELKPSLVLCDTIMPGLNGFEVLKEVQRDSNIDEIPFIFLSTSTEMGDLRKGMEMGADDYLVKPVEHTSLLRSIETRILKYKKRKNVVHDKKNAEKEKILKENSTIFLMLNNHPHFIKVFQIAAINSSNQYTTLYTIDNHKVIFRKSLNTWEQILPESMFIRIHRSTIINTNYITRVEKWLKFSFKIYIEGIEKPFEISKRYASKLRTHF